MTLRSYILCIVYTVYLLLGGLIFTYLEYDVKKEITTSAQPTWIRLKELTVIDIKTADNEKELTELTQWLHQECETLPSYVSFNLTILGNRSEEINKIEAICPFLTNSVVTVEYDYPWSLIDSIYFSMTVITTIGFGHISPSTAEGKIACILYSLIGIPLTLLLLARTSSFFGRRLYDLFTSRVNSDKQRSKIFIGIGVFLYILFGLVIFILLPAVLFMYSERWSYLDSVYFSYITLTTIGFGDFVTGKNMDGGWLVVYQIGVILWIMAGLGYWVMVANFMVLALKSKNVYAMARRVTELKRLVSQVNGSQPAPEFISKNSKTSFNFLIQLASELSTTELQNISVTSSQESSVTKIENPNMNKPVNRPIIPGISALFSNSTSGGMPLFQKVLETGKSIDINQENKGHSTT